MDWKEFFRTMNPDQRKAAAAALSSATEETRPAQSNKQTQVVLVDAREVRKSTAKMHAENARRQAEKYAQDRNRRTREVRGER